MNKSISKSSFDNKQIDHNDYIIDKYGKELHQIFNYYCSFGSFSNNQHLKSTNFTKLRNLKFFIKLKIIFLSN